MKMYRSFIVAALVAAAGCAPVPAEQEFVRTEQNGEQLQDQSSIAAVRAAYRERVRLGLGSPFRVMEIAVRDTRLPASSKNDLLPELFEQIADGDIYRIGGTLPNAHYRVIESAMKSAADPRVSELAINLAYEIATLEQTVTPELQYAASSTAALMRDRTLAQRDAARIRNFARTRNAAPHTLVPALRASRSLSVEQPPEFVLSNDAQSEASRLAVMLVGGVRQAARTRSVANEAIETSHLSRDVATQILALPHNRPPQAALNIAMRTAELPFEARDEERFVAELALHDGRTALAAQRAAIALRPFAQERIWSADTKAPTAVELLTRYGVRVDFDAAVPADWRPYYRFVLDDALADLMRVTPGLNLKGLTIEIGDVDAASHLAFHDPRRRVIRWAPATGSGSLAHEIAHDLDWQIARRTYGRTGYGSEVARDVAAMVLETGGSAGGRERPTETFARQLDWTVAGALAALGRVNGHLSSVQHDWLPGHGSARPPLANSRSANALAGMAARGGKLDKEAREGLEQAVLAANLPASVHAIRRLRDGTELAVGPRVTAMNPMPDRATSNLLDMLGKSAGVVVPLPKNEGQAAPWQVYRPE